MFLVVLQHWSTGRTTVEGQGFSGRVKVRACAHTHACAVLKAVYKAQGNIREETVQVPWHVCVL